MFCAESMATMVRISSAHPRSTDAMSIFDIGGSSGNSAILRPKRVSNPSSSNAFKLYNCSSAVTKVCAGGGSMKSNPPGPKSLIPIAFKVKHVIPKFVL